MGEVVTGIGDRATFRALRRPAGRAVHGPVRVAFVPGEPGVADPASRRVAYAIGRTCGNAVRRNRMRRRFRAAVRQVAGDLSPGSYLVRPEPSAAALSFDELTRAVREAMVIAGRPRTRSALGREVAR